MLFQVSTELKDKTQIGVFASKTLNDDSKYNFGFGLKKSLNSNNTLKAKIDRNLLGALYLEHKMGKAVGIQATVAKSFSQDSNLRGFLESDYAIGLKFKYDN